MSRGVLPNNNYAYPYSVNPSPAPGLIQPGAPTINSTNKPETIDQTLGTTSATYLTRSKKAIYSNSWKIEDFPVISDEKLISSEFSGTTGDNQQIAWHYKLGYDSQYASKYVVSVVFKTNSTSQNVKIDMHSFGSISGIIGTKKFELYLPHNIVVLILQNVPLTLNFTVTFFNNSKDASLPKSTLADNLASLLQNDQFADLTITVGSETFRAHKAILGARSTVFAAMFQHDMQESQRNKVTIKDMKPKVFREVLRFIYTDKAEGMEQMACELLAAADKYDLDRLKVMCEIALIEGITVGSVTETLIMADLHRAKELKARAIQFIGENLKAMPDWSEFCSSRSDLMAEILNSIAASK